MKPLFLRSVLFVSYFRHLYLRSIEKYVVFLVCAMLLGELPVPGPPTIWMIVGQGPTALAVGAGGGCLDILFLIYLYSPLSPFRLGDGLI